MLEIPVIIQIICVRIAFDVELVVEKEGSIVWAVMTLPSIYELLDSFFFRRLQLPPLVLAQQLRNV